MNGDEGLTSFESSLETMLRKLGLPDPALMSAITTEWQELAGEPWWGRSKPVLVHGKTLVVEANAPSVVAFLKYGKTSLLKKLGERFGEGVIEQVDIRFPDR